LCVRGVSDYVTALSPRLLKPPGKVYRNSPQTTDSRAVSCVFVYARALAVARILFCNTPIVVRTSRLKTTDPFSVVVRRGYTLLFFSKRKENTWCINTSHYRQLRCRVLLSRPPRVLWEVGVCIFKSTLGIILPRLNNIMYLYLWPIRCNSSSLHINRCSIITKDPF